MFTRFLAEYVLVAKELQPNCRSEKCTGSGEKAGGEADVSQTKPV